MRESELSNIRIMNKKKSSYIYDDLFILYEFYPNFSLKISVV